MKLAYKQFDLRLRHVFTISRSSTLVQPTLIVQLSHEGHHGYGEATVNAYYGATIENMATAIESVRPLVESCRTVDPESILPTLAQRLAENPFALCALDEALHDLWGKCRGAQVAQLWGLRPEHIPPSNFTLGMDSLEVMIEKLREMPDWPIYKVKLGLGGDLECIRELRCRTSAPFRVDANGAWTARQTLDLVGELQSLGVDLVEQPLPPGNLDGAELLFGESPIPIIADESCVSLSDLEFCVGRFHGVNIKLTKCGGLVPVRQMISRARQLGLKVMVGCMTESTVGISAIAQVAALTDFADMDGAALLAEDIALGVRIQRGQPIFPDTNGTGVTLFGGSF